MESRRGSKRYVALAVLAIGLFRGPAAASETLPVDQVRAGMKGYGLTVVRGYGVERFDVEVIGVLRNAAVGRSVILVSLSGLDLAETGVVAGMSGSPVYLEGRLAGAVASGWGFSKKAVAGVTPIESMASIVPETTRGCRTRPGRRAADRGPRRIFRSPGGGLRGDPAGGASTRDAREPAGRTRDPGRGLDSPVVSGRGDSGVHAGRVSRAALTSRGERRRISHSWEPHPRSLRAAPRRPLPPPSLPALP